MGITAAATAIQRKIDGFVTTTLIISNEKMNNILKIAHALQDF